MINPKVSVIIPIIKYSENIAKTVESAINQTYQPAEIVVVDASNDAKVTKVLQSFQSQIVYLHHELPNMIDARNSGIKQASGKYIALLDLDYIWLLDKLEKQMQILKDHPEVDLVFHDLYQYSINSSTLPTYWQKYNIQPCRGERACLAQLFKNNFIPGGVSEVFKKTLTETNGWFDEGLGTIATYDYWLRAISRGAVIDYIDIPLALITSSTKLNTKETEQRLRATINILNWVLERNYDYFKNYRRIVRSRFLPLRAQATLRHLRARRLRLALENGIETLNKLLELSS